MYYTEYCVEFDEYYVIDSTTGTAICSFEDAESACEYAYNMNLNSGI